MKFYTAFLGQQCFKCGISTVFMSTFKVLIWKHSGLRLKMLPCLVLLSKKVFLVKCKSATIKHLLYTRQNMTLRHTMTKP